MRFVTFRNDCDSLLHMKPQQNLQGHDSGQHTHTTCSTHTHPADLCRAAAVLPCNVDNHRVLQQLVGVCLASLPAAEQRNKRSADLGGKPSAL